MKAIRIHKFGGPEVLQLEDAPKPTPGEGYVLVKVKAVGVHPLDSFIRNGEFGPVPFPHILGLDAAGIVEAVGHGVHNVKVGERVFCYSHGGVYAEYCVAKANRTFHLPQRLSFVEGAAVPVSYFTALRALKYRAKAKAGESILIHGASGAVGLAACELAVGMKLHVVGTASTPEGAELVKKAGAAVVLNHRDAEHRKHLGEAAGGKGFDIILEMAAATNLATDLMFINPNGGRIIVNGSSGMAKDFDPRFIIRNEANILGSNLDKSNDEEWKEMGHDIVKGIEHNQLHPVVDRAFPFQDAGKAQVASLAPGSKGRVVIQVQE